MPKPPGRLSFTVGLPRSGKSTFCNEWVRAAGERPRVIVSGDDFRLAVYGDVYNRIGESFVFSTMDAAIRAHLLGGSDVLVDETATTTETLMRYLLLDIEAEPIFINTSSEICIERAIKTKQEYLIPVIQKLDRQLSELRKNWQETLDSVKARIIARYAV